MHQEAVVRLGEWVDGVDVRRQEQSRLRLTHGDDVFGAEPAQDVIALSISDEPSRPGKTCRRSRRRRDDAGMNTAPDPGFSATCQCPSCSPRPRCRRVGRPRDVAVAGANHLPMRHHPDGRRIDATADIEPFDEHCAVETGPIGWHQRNYPGGEVSGIRRRHAPPAIRAELGSGTVGRRRPGARELFGNITDAGYVEGAQQECGLPGRRCGRSRNSADRHVRIIAPPALSSV